jgi:predicted nucleic acid-binding protein
MVAREGRGLSLVDWTTVVVARKLNASVFAFDEDFTQEGIVSIP